MVWGQIAGALIGGAASIFSAKSQNEANRDISGTQMAFQREMSNTQYQRGMADMRAAGLNPILAYKQGGASSPAGASIPAVPELEAGVATAQQALRLKADIGLIKAQTKTQSEEARIKKNEADVTDKWATSIVGRLGGTVETTIRRILDELGLGGQTSAKSKGSWVRTQNLPPQFRYHKPGRYGTRTWSERKKLLKKDLSGRKKK